MLKFFSRLERTRNFVLLFFAIVMVLSLIVAGSLFRDTTQSSAVGSTATAAKVGSEKITVGEIANLKQGRAASLPSKYLLNSLISQRIIRLEADRLGLRPSDAEVAAEIRRRNRTEDGTPIDQARYERFAVDQAGSIAAYENSVRDELAQMKLEAFLTSGVTVSEEEVLNDYRRKNSKFDVTYLPVSVTDLAQTIKPTEDELRAYFDKNKASYYISSPQKKIRYIFTNTAKIGEKLTISDEDLKAAYDRIPADKRKKGIEGQQIVLRVAKPEFETQVTAKATELLERLRKDGPTVSEEAFAELAKGQSEDAGTARTGGKIPGLIRENPNNPTDPYQRLLSMKEGDITEPITFQNRVFILRRGKDVPKTFEDAKPELIISERNRRADTANAELTQKIRERLAEIKDPRKVAEEFAAQANMNAAEMVRETPFVKPGDNIENVGINPEFEGAIAPLENPNDVGEKLRITNGFAVPMLVEKRDPRDADFEEVRDQVAESVKLEQARARVEQIAKEVAEGAGSASGLAAAATAKGLKAQDQKAFILGSPLGQGPSASTSEALEDAIYALKDGEVTKTPVKVGDNWYVVGVTKREDANMENFAKERDSLLQAKLNEKRGQIFYEYIGSTRLKMEKAGDIVIYKDAIARLDETTETPDLPPGFPIGQ